MKTPKEVSSIFGCSEEQARALMLSNAEQLREMGKKARLSKSGKCRGFTHAELCRKVLEIESVLKVKTI